MTRRFLEEWRKSGIMLMCPLREIWCIEGDPLREIWCPLREIWCILDQRSLQKRGVEDNEGQTDFVLLLAPLVGGPQCVDIDITRDPDEDPPIPGWGSIFSQIRNDSRLDNNDLGTGFRV
jgi:hypothetical protein